MKTCDMFSSSTGTLTSTLVARMSLLLPMSLQSEGAIPALAVIEMPMVSMLVSMETRGICLSKRVLGLQKPAMLRKLKQLEERAAQANGGEKFNLAAAGEVGKVRRIVVVVGWVAASGLGLTPACSRANQGRELKPGWQGKQWLCTLLLK